MTVNPGVAGRTPGSSADIRAAAGLVTSLSSYVITAALAVLGAQAVVVTFVIDKRVDLVPFYLVAGTGTLALVSSIIFGGLGIYEIAMAGARGEWKVETRRGKFNLQSILALLGTVLIVISAFLGNAKPS